MKQCARGARTSKPATPRLPRTIEVVNGVEALIGAGKARAMAGRIEESRDTLVRALGYLGTMRQDDEVRALAREGAQALAGLEDGHADSA